MLTRQSRRPRSWAYGLLSIAMVLGITIGQPLTAQAINWGELLLRGIQVVQLSSISDAQEMELGKQINDNITKQARISRDSNLVNYVNNIGQRLARQSDRPNLTYTFQVVEDDNINAFATMGGYVYVHTGLLKAADNEAQVASVIAHEIGHITGKHSIKQTREDAIAQGLLSATGLKKSTVVTLGTELALRRPHSRRDEYDADQRGLKTVTAASYSQPEMVRFMEKLLAFRSSIPAFLSTHPDTGSRITQLEAMIKKSPSNGKDGTDNVDYARRVGKKATGSSPIASPTPIASPISSPSPTPKPRGGDVIVPTE
jgi:beta-barrel assembly-enhancing protease